MERKAMGTPEEKAPLQMDWVKHAGKLGGEDRKENIVDTEWNECLLFVNHFTVLSFFTITFWC